MASSSVRIRSGRAHWLLTGLVFLSVLLLHSCRVTQVYGGPGRSGDEVAKVKRRSLDIVSIEGVSLDGQAITVTRSEGDWAYELVAVWLGADGKEQRHVTDVHWYDDPMQSWGFLPGSYIFTVELNDQGINGPNWTGTDSARLEVSLESGLEYQLYFLHATDDRFGNDLVEWVRPTGRNEVWRSTRGTEARPIGVTGSWEPTCRLGWF